MAFPKGAKRPADAGRKKGTPNKKTQDLMAKCQELDVDPFEILLRFAKGDWDGLGYESSVRVAGVSKDGEPFYEDTIPPDLRAKCAKDACEYIHPKRKAIEHSGAVDTGLQSIIDDLSGKSPAELKKIVNG
jgi:hypothetical protein